MVGAEFRLQALTWVRVCSWAAAAGLCLACATAFAATDADEQSGYFDRPPIVYSDRFDSSAILWECGGALGCMLLAVPGLVGLYAGLVGWPRPAEAPKWAFAAILATTLIWVLWGYSFSFAPRETMLPQHPTGSESAEHGTDATGTTWIGGGGYVCLRGLSSQLANDRPEYPIRQRGDGVPHLLFVAFQLSWFTLAAAPLLLLLGQLYRGPTVWLALAVWSTVAFAPLVHAEVAPSGILNNLLDYGLAAPGHLAVGAAALVFGLVSSRRKHIDPSSEVPHNRLVLTSGTFLLWIGTTTLLLSRARLGTGLAANVLIGTHLAAASGAVGMPLLRWVTSGVWDSLDVCRGAVIGLVANTAAAGFVPPQSSMVIGLLAAMLGCPLLLLLRTIRIRLAAEVALLHGYAALAGLLLTGVFATSAVAGFDEDGRQINGLLGGNADQFLTQLQNCGIAALIAITGALLTAGSCAAANAVASFLKHSDGGTSRPASSRIDVPHSKTPSDSPGCESDWSVLNPDPHAGSVHGTQR